MNHGQKKSDFKTLNHSASTPKTFLQSQIREFYSLFNTQSELHYNNNGAKYFYSAGRGYPKTRQLYY